MKRFVAVVMAIGLASAGLAVHGAGQHPRATSTPIPGQRPSWATPAASAVTPATETVPIRVYLKLRNAPDAEARAAAVSDPDNPAYGKYLTPDQVLAAYSPTSADVSQVSAWLAAQGLTVGYVPVEPRVRQRDRHRHEGRGRVRDPLRPVPGAWHRGARAVHRPDGTGRHQRDDRRRRRPRPERTLVQPAHRGRRHRGPQPAARAGPGRAPAPPRTEPGVPCAPPCSQYYGQKLATTLPAYGGGFPSTLPWVTCGYQPGQIRSGVRPRRRGRLRHRRARGDRRRRGRVRVAHDQA